MGKDFGQQADLAVARARTMNDFCSYCGGLAASDLKKKHVRDWVANHPAWKSDNTKRDYILRDQAKP